MKDTVSMKFICGEDFKSMSCTENGRFCSVCQKEVYDFTQTPLSKLRQLQEENGELCGIFSVEQTDPDIISEIRIPEKFRVAAFISSLFFSMNAESVAAQNTVDPKMEQSQGASNAPKESPEEVHHRIKNGQHVSMSRGEEKQESSSTDENEAEKKQNAKKYKAHRPKHWYLSKKFPFVRRRSRWVGGLFY